MTGSTMSKTPTTLPREVFVDTSAFYAAVDTADDQHHPAGALLDRMFSEDITLVTTSCVVVEATALLQARLGLKAARVFLDSVVPPLDIAWVEADLHARGLEAWLAAGRRSLSLVDCISFALMHELHLDTVFTLDRHFAEQGFRVVPEA
jgi:predicted nucleic acid-binding protein